MVEHQSATLKVGGSNPLSRSKEAVDFITVSIWGDINKYPGSGEAPGYGVDV